MLNQELIRKEFGFLKDVVFLNVSSVVIPPLSVQNAYKGFMDYYVSNFGEDAVSKAWQIVAEARGPVSRLINCAEEEVAFVKNTAEGIGIVAQGYPFPAGSNIIVADQEHSANLYSWIAMQKKGLTLKLIKSKNGRILASDIEASIDQKTQALALSAVQFTTGYYSELKTIGKICRKHGILFIVDGIQAVGRLEINVRDMHIDYLACGGNKGLLATLGVGFVYCANHLALKIIPPYASYQSVIAHAAPPAITENFEELPYYPHARRLESGNLNYAGIAAITAGVKILLSLGLDNIQQHILFLDGYLRKKLYTLSLPFNDFPEAHECSGIICIYYPAQKEKDVIQILQRKKIYCTMRGGYIRMGINFYNTVEHMDIVYEACKEIQNL